MIKAWQVLDGIARRAVAIRPRVGWIQALGLALTVPAGLVSGCSAAGFNPSFLNVVFDPTVDDTGTVSNITLPNATGHVPLLLANQTTFDPSLLDFLEETGSDLSYPNLRPRVRLRVRINYVSGGSNTVELIDGSPVISATTATGETTVPPPELTQSTLTNVVAVCDVASIVPEQVEVFVPVSFTTITLQETENNVIREVSDIQPPQFTVLQPDSVDASNNVTVVRNFDIRNQPVEVSQVQCGSVIGFVIAGELSTTFVNFQGVFIPGALDTNDAGAASNPGRFNFQTTVR